MAKKKAKKTAKKSAKRIAKKIARKPAAKRAKKARRSTLPASWFGLVIDGKRVPYSLASVEDARIEAAALEDQGYKVAIYDQDSGKIVK